MDTFPTRAPRLIASDIDGTLLDRNHRVPRRNRDAVARAVQQGAYFALSTGRPFRWIEPVLERLLAGGAGIVNLSIERPSLHEAFVRIVGEPVEEKAA